MRMSRLLWLVLLTVPALGAENDPKTMFAKHWQVAKEFSLAVAEAMPAEGYDFKPSPDLLMRPLPPGDHYEESNSLGRQTAPRLFAALRELLK